MNKAARKVLLPTLVVTELASKEDKGATRIDLPNPVTLSDGTVVTSYYVRPKRLDNNDTSAAERIDGKPRWVGYRFNLFPVVIGGDGVPWAEANTYVQSRLEGKVNPIMLTYAGIADDLAAYRRFLDETGVDWMYFPQNRLYRPTYRYNGYLKRAVESGEIAASSAKRRMGNVIAFYRWLKEDGILIPEHAPWIDTDRYIEIKRPYGGAGIMRVTTTDVTINMAKQDDPYTDIIEDGGRLRPLSQEEQEWLLHALAVQGNTEMMLIHLMGILTGARLQTILTFQVRHVKDELSPSLGEKRLPVGPGTGIDTKNDKRMVLHVPAWFYEKLHIYANSKRARKRRERAIGGDTDDQYLFLSIRGMPLYNRKEDSHTFNESNILRHRKTGQGVRQFITERIVPFIRAYFNKPRFHFMFHDTRATFGMNLTDAQLQLVQEKKITLSQAREFVRVRMGHESSATTDRYLQFRDNQKLVRQANEQYDRHLKALSEKAMEGLL